MFKSVFICVPLLLSMIFTPSTQSPQFDLQIKFRDQTLIKIRFRYSNHINNSQSNINAIA